ncbi:hypothetical protein [Magnetospirillum sp. SS-4]|uniref:hypothetical protein n=1 Tax=Magnetospirillum sp. SS-4 TaxID=2681465 RepID=UPI001384BEDB|nr:hypothetical protein [Magnetospirillum sp. SS-4]CAA7626925.1 hypothetical protein MTBSS4_70073 [Magnetospirillum sp. SS-4]
MRDGGVQVWVRDRTDAPVAATGKAALLANGRKTEVTLAGGDMPKPDGVPPGREKDLLAYIRAMQAANGLGGAMPSAPTGGHAGH